MKRNTEPLTADPQIMRDWVTKHFGATPPGLLAVCSTRNFAGIRTADIGNLVEWAMAEDRAGAEGIYVRVTTIAPGSVTSGRGKAADSHALLDMWSDLDFGSDGHATTGLPKDADEAADIPAVAGLPAATQTHHSGGGLYKRWNLTVPAVIGEDIDLAAAAQLAADWQNILLLGAKKMGVDYGAGVKDLARVLRLPGTINRKAGRTQVMCRVLEASGPSYTLEELLEIADALKPKPKPAPVRVAPTPRPAAGHKSRNDGPGPIEILGNHPCCGEILSYVGCTYHQQEPGSCSYCGGDCQQWLRPGWSTGASTTGVSVHKGGAAVTVRTDNFPGFDPGSLNQVLSPPMLFAALHHGGDLSAAAADIRHAANDTSQATSAARALPAEVLEEVRATSRTGRGQHLRPVPAPRPAPPIDGANALQYAEPEEQAQPVDDVPPAPEVGFDLAEVFNLPGVKAHKNYKVDSRGVFMRRPGKGEEPDTWIRITFAPIVVTCSYVDSDGEQLVELAWTDRGKVVAKPVPRDVAKRGRELIKYLGSAGLPAIEADARPLERWLAEFEVENLGVIPHEAMARNLGWQRDGQFVAAPDKGVKLEVKYDEQRVPSTAYGAVGTFEDWRTAMGRLENYTVPRIIIAASLAAPLLKPLDVRSFTVDISSRSTKGKTTALQCGCSVWANPSEDAPAISNWRGTAFAIEKRLNLVRGLPTFLDETMSVSDETIIDYVLYQLPMNQGKDRSGGYAGALPWETILMSTGERTILSYTRNQGAAGRALCTTEAPFGNNGGPTAVSTRDAVLQNYGHAGPAFVELVRKGLAREGGRERLRLRHKELTEQFRGDNDMTGRRAPMVAALALAEAMACETGVLPYDPLPVATWQRVFTSANATDNQAEMAMDVVREYLAAHDFELWPGGMDQRPPLRGWLGAVKTTDTETRIAVLPERLRGILDDAGYKLDAVVDTWADAGYLASAVDKKKITYRIVTRFDGRTARCFQFTPLALGETSDQQAMV
ncbi:DUF927 domain-containing protein [Streptomyces sp. NPDC058620]|uniref:DUF927 domain-containing protein n=1 Tax=Streptomyces sp. NPDC058620 TaxID=3346560 RepID=UPI00364DA674